MRVHALCSLIAALLLLSTCHAWPCRAEAEAPTRVSRPDVPGETIIAPTRRQVERRALRQLLAERDAERALLQARAATAPESEQLGLQAAIEQHKRGTRLALLERQLAFARERGDFALARRLKLQRARAAALVAAPPRDGVAR